MERLIIEELDNYMVNFPAGGVTSVSKNYCVAHPHPNPNRMAIAVQHFKTQSEALDFVTRFNQAIDAKDDRGLERVMGEKALSRLKRQLRSAQRYFMD